MQTKSALYNRLPTLVSLRNCAQLAKLITKERSFHWTKQNTCTNSIGMEIKEMKRNEKQRNEKKWNKTKAKRRQKSKREQTKRIEPKKEANNFKCWNKNWLRNFNCIMAGAGGGRKSLKIESGSVQGPVLSQSHKLSISIGLLLLPRDGGAHSLQRLINVC